MWAAGTSLMDLLLLVIIVQSAMAFLSWTWLHAASVLVSIFGYVAFIFLYGALPASWGVGEYYGVPRNAYTDLSGWATLLLCTVGIAGPQVLMIVIRRHFFSTDMHAARAAYKTKKNQLPWASEATNSNAAPLIHGKGVSEEDVMRAI